MNSFFKLRKKRAKSGAVKPEQPFKHLTFHKSQLSSKDQLFLKKLHFVTAANLSDPTFNAKALSKLLFMSYSTSLRRVKSTTGMTIKEFIRKVRIRKAATLLVNAPQLTIFHIATDCGYRSNAHFSREFKRTLGCSPSEFRKANQ